MTFSMLSLARRLRAQDHNPGIEGHYLRPGSLTWLSLAPFSPAQAKFERYVLPRQAGGCLGPTMPSYR
jgi:hypothetical protein